MFGSKRGLRFRNHASKLPLRFLKIGGATDRPRICVLGESKKKHEENLHPYISRESVFFYRSKKTDFFRSEQRASLRFSAAGLTVRPARRRRENFFFWPFFQAKNYQKPCLGPGLAPAVLLCGSRSPSGAPSDH